MLIKKRWARPHQAHITSQNAPQLWQFIQAAPSEEGADWRQPLVRVLQKVRSDSGGVHAHAAKFWHFEDLIALWEAEEPNMYEPALLYTLSTGVELVKSASFTPIEHLGKRKLIYRAP